MKKYRLSFYCLTAVIFISSCNLMNKNIHTNKDEKSFKNIKQITHGGKNAEAYFSMDSRWLIYQSHNEENKCDQMYVMRTDGGDKRLVSTGKGRVTCGYFVDLGPAEKSRIIYSSTHDFSDECPPEPDRRKGYVWPIYDSYEIYIDDFKGGNLKRLTNNKAYDAEATVSPDGKSIVFTSTRDGDLDLYLMDVDGKNLKRLTSTLGYDGGAFFTPDGKRIIYRAYYPKTKKEKEEYVSLLKQGLFRPSYLEIFTINLDGTNKKKITNLGVSSFAPFMHKNNEIIFSTNYPDLKGRAFHLYMMDQYAKSLKKLTTSGYFNSFPMFSYDGKKLVWASDRGGKKRGEINIFIADWVEE